MRVLPSLPLALLALTACNTPCQRLCVRLADYAEECGYTVPDAELEACIDEQADADDQKACRQSGDPQTIRTEWSCDDLEAFFD